MSDPKKPPEVSTSVVQGQPNLGEVSVVAYAIGDDGITTPVYMAPSLPYRTEPPNTDIPIPEGLEFRGPRGALTREGFEALVDLITEEKAKVMLRDAEITRLKRLIQEIYALICPGWAGDFGNEEMLKGAISRRLSELAEKK